jgi:Bacterial pre-peptidase C-terminal domain./Subtilase family.
MTGGILAGAGNLNPTMAGMATGTQLHVFDITNYPQIVNAVTNNATLGTTVSSTSYSQGCNEYNTTTQFGDQTTRDNPQLIFVFSAGNNASADCNYGAGAGWGNITGGYKVGKNVIAVANLDALEVRDNSSSRGPAPDGRIKPDISANGRDQNSTDANNTYQIGGGTSAACPGIAGIALQLTQAYKELNSAANAPTALIKACLLNSAEDIGNPGPDFTYGYGRVNALRALQTIEDNRYLSASVSQGNTNTHSITVPANVAELRVMVYWHDEGGTPLASVSLVNDLDVTVTDPSSTVWQPWVLDHTPNVAALTSNATRGPDHLNNMEQITIPNPPAGTYTVTVDGFAVPAGPQEYYLVYEFRYDEIKVLYPMGGEGFVPGQQELIRWDGLRGIGNFNIQYSTNGGTTWTPIANNVSSTTQHYNWTVPSVVTGQHA